MTIKIDLKFRYFLRKFHSLYLPITAMLTNFASNYNSDKLEQIIGSNYLLQLFFYGDLKICGISAWRAAKMSSRESIFFFVFRCPTASLSQYVSYSSKIKQNILFRSIVFRIKFFYKHLDITPNVPLNIC